METEAKTAAKRFLELSQIKRGWDNHADIKQVMLAQEFFNLRDVFLFLPEDMTADYFKDLDNRSFMQILELFTSS